MCGFPTKYLLETSLQYWKRKNVNTKKEASGMAFSGFLAHVHDVFANFNLILKGLEGGLFLFCFGERGWVGSQRNRWCKSDKLAC